MVSNTYTEDEFKKVLKNLFAEKKRVKELQKQLEERGVQKKFQAKLTDIHKLSLTEEYAKLKNAYLEKEKENSQLKGQLEKVRPALKKLVYDLKSARAELEKYQAHDLPGNREIHKEQLVKEEGDSSTFHTELIELKKSLNEKTQQLSHLLEEKVNLENQNQTLHAKLKETRALFQDSDLTAAQERYEILLNELTQKEKAQENVLECSYTKMRELSTRHAEMMQECEVLYREKEESQKRLTLAEAEIRQAQHHLAKKVKESTILHDLVERQKIRLVNFQGTIEKQQIQIEQMQKSLNLQKQQEEDVQTLENEWQEKFFALQQDWDEQKAQLIELQEMRKTYDQMSSTFSNLKNILGKNVRESQPTEEIEKNYPGD